MPSRSKREHLRRLVEGKNEWSRQPTHEERALGFLGWHERGFLPHCDFPNLVQFVTFRLGDSMPATRRDEWGHLLKIEDARERRVKLEDYLDRGSGRCQLRAAKISRIVENALLHFHGDRYELLAWCVMPNHVHVLVDVQLTPLWKIIQNWKVRTARETGQLLRLEHGTVARPVLKANGNEPSRCSALQPFWQREYWDTVMRDEQQKQKAIRYIENNPVKAKLCRVPSEYAGSSAGRRDSHQRLIILNTNN